MPQNPNLYFGSARYHTLRHRFAFMEQMIDVKKICLFVAICIGLTACQKENTEEPAEGPSLIMKFKFDPAQARLNNIGQPSALPAGNAGQSPAFNGMSAHYIELAPDAFTALGKGSILYKAPETQVGGGNAIDFEQSSVKGNGEVFFTMPLKNIKPGQYEWLRLSLAYQNLDVQFRIDTVISGITISGLYTGTVAGFIGYNTYLKSYKVKTDTITVNGNRKQGYWGFEATGSFGGMNKTFKSSGQSPEGGTTVVNPLASTSPIPAGSCVVTAAFHPGKLVISGTEKQDIVVEVSLSTNKSVEWTEIVNNGQWDPLKGEKIVDMGIRGMIPHVY